MTINLFQSNRHTRRKCERLCCALIYVIIWFMCWRWYWHTEQIRNQNENQSFWHNEFYELESIINLIRIRIRKQADDMAGHSKTEDWGWYEDGMRLRIGGP